MTVSYRIAGAAFAAFAVATSAYARPTYDVAADFSFDTNPTGIWTYAFAEDLGGTITPLNLAFGSAGNLRGWNSTAIESLGTPTVYRNDSGGDFLGVPDGSIGVHPCFDTSIADFAVIRFTAPSASLYTVNAQFFAGDGGNTDAYILLNTLAQTPIYSVDTTGNNPSFFGSVALNAGDTLDFVVGTGGDDYFSDTTPVAITLTSGAVAVPEAGAGSLLALGGSLLGAVGIVLRRRK